MEDGSTLVRLLAALGVIALLLFALAAVLQYVPLTRAAGSARRRLVDPIETTALSSVSALHVVKILDRYYVLGSSSGSVCIVCPLEKEGVEGHLRAQRARPPVSLRSILRAIRRRWMKRPFAGGNRTKVR
jgi:Flagellar biosynthesis protein, FliO